jgi:hypothetical protein
MLNEKEVTYLENQIPILAEYATKQAFWQALASGDSVLIAEDGKLIEVFPDGSRIFKKEIEKPVKVTQRIFRIQK